MASAWTRIIAGDERKRSRFHDFAGNLAPLPAWRYLPACVASTLRTKWRGSYAGGPWLGYRAVARIESLAAPSWLALEFGSGFSSPWLSQQCGALWSIETDPEWFAAVTQLLMPRGNATLLLQSPPFDRSALPDEPFDFVLVDGLARDRAMELALAVVRRPGGHIYLDNSDVDDREHCTARQLLLSNPAVTSTEQFVDFSPGHVTVTQGILAKF